MSSFFDKLLKRRKKRKFKLVDAVAKGKGKDFDAEKQLSKNIRKAFKSRKSEDK